MCNLSEGIFEEGFQEGFKFGFRFGFAFANQMLIEKGRLLMLNDLIQNGFLSVSQAADSVHMSRSELMKRMNALNGICP